MKFNSLLFIVLVCLVANAVQAQKLQNGEFLSKKGDYLKVINDSQLISNITPYENVNTYQITDDSLITTKKSRMTDGKGSRDTISRKAFKMLVNSSDAFSLRKYQDQGTPYESIDTITFIKIERLLRPVNNFQLIVLKTFSGFEGTRTIQIDGKGNLLYIHVPVVSRPDAKPRMPKKVVGVLTKKEFQTFLYKLSRAMIVPPTLKECFVLDYSSEMTITINGRNYNSNHCTDNYLHSELTSYLVNLKDSKTIQKSN
ncbi:MAG: hypothetical protein EOP48_07945 [Sphingobacteriales bacterium]|nr:MAG: hypothetical protein EOP48_07945 [Sphingobacteriales bacterium]